MTDTAPAAEALYVLGDLFEYWAGDDDLDDAFNQSVADAFAHLGSQGTSIYLMHGNRDFLIGQAFAATCHARILSDPTLINLYGTPTLLTHGDALCTDDEDYQNFRAKVRTQEWQTSFLAQPLAERKSIIEELRSKSAIEKQLKPAAIMDVNKNAVHQLLELHHNPIRLIHGHTHRPARHALQLPDNVAGERWVLPDWDGHAGYLRCDANCCSPIGFDHKLP